MPRICLKHLLTHTWILFIYVAVNCRVSDPYSNADLTFEEKILSFVFNDREFVRQDKCISCFTDACLDILACATGFTNDTTRY